MRTRPKTLGRFWLFHFVSSSSVAVIILTSLASAPALAQNLAAAKVSSADDLALGLNRLHWGMTARDAKIQYPDLDGLIPELWQPVSSLSMENYVYAGCSFIMHLAFDAGKLSGVDLNENGGAFYKTCRNRIKAALLKQYGQEPGGFSPGPQPHGYSAHAEWLGPVTDVTYSDIENAFIDVAFARTAAPP